ncbi:penicillin acylase family protein [Nocardioides lijunqiniae]|uniref:penicillin acylase family protein n=1 Tax=Nocardioides lijunqiniae TaxID=2760832 RepID=UPI001D0C205C|nr:penicillin acylase family protein [Nocardioides lijunqiniae]
MAEHTAAPRERRPGFRGLPRGLRVTTYVAVLVALTLVAGLATFVVLARRPLPQTTGELVLPGLTGEVEVVRDEHGIPQLYADTLDDLMRGQGYVHAQERFFEMDVRRHATAGRLAEMFGEDALETDLYVRTMGWRRVAERELALVEPSTRTALEAYAAGVNAFLAESSPTETALEYTVLNAGGLDYHPEDWTAVDSLAWLKAMAWDLRGNMAEEIDRVLTADAVGARRAAELYPAYPYAEHAPIVQQGAVVDGVFEQDATTGGTRNPQRAPFTAAQRAPLAALGEGLARMPSWLGRGEGLGSNSWVVDGEHSATGEPLLANDPHLGVGIPGVWMQMGLHCRRVGPECPLDVAGFTFSGVPGVIIGHNADIAWGFTNLGPDVTDLFVERVRGDTWRYDGRRRPLKVRTETVEVAGGDDVELTVRETDHGPLVSDVDEAVARVAGVAGSRRSGPERDEYAVALSWTALQPGTTADAILGLNAATDWDSFRDAAADFAVPAQNLVYADRAGHIGYQAPGLVPIRRSGNDGTVPSAGWRPENDWTGEFVPYDGLPRVLDPDEGFLVTANQAVIGEDDYPYFLTGDWDRGYRSERIRRELLDDGELSVADMGSLQLDDRHPLAPVLTPYLLDVRLRSGYADDGQRLLRGWDFRQQADSGAAAYFNVVWRNLLELTFHDELTGDQRPDGGSRWMGVVEQLLERPRSPWWDDVTTDDVVETRDDVLAAAQLAARDELTSRISPDAGEWRWGDLHRLDLRSTTLGESGIGPVERMVNRGGWEVGGGAATVDATGWDAREGYGVVTAPSMRMVVSLGDLDESRWVNLTGVSGHPFSAHHTDQTDVWAAGGSLPWVFSREAVLDAGADTLTLVPADGD